MSKVLMVHPERCNGCRECEVACAAYHDGKGQVSFSRIRVGEFPENNRSIPSACQQCYTAACVAVCPKEAMTSNRETGEVEWDRSKCIACKFCVTACPFGNATYEEETKTIVRCDLCSGDPACVKVCKQGALEYVDNTSAAASRRRAAITRRSIIAK